MQKFLSVCLMAAAASAQEARWDESATGDWGAIAGVGKVNLKVEISGSEYITLTTQKSTVTFLHETNWSGTAGEEVEVLFCELSIENNANQRCWLLYIVDPIKST